jgi:hypothetical protein
MAAIHLAAFGQGLAALDDLKEVNLALALLWFFDHEGEPEVKASRLATTIHDLSLRNQVTWRLGTNLRAHPDVVRGKGPGVVRLKLSRKAALDDK